MEKSENWPINKEFFKERDVAFDSADMDRIRKVVKLVYDNYEEMHPGMECKREQLETLQDKLTASRTAGDTIVVRLSNRDMFDLGRVCWWWADTDFFHPDSDDEDPRDAEYALADLVDAVRERHFE